MSTTDKLFDLPEEAAPSKASAPEPAAPAEKPSSGTFLLDADPVESMVAMGRGLAKAIPGADYIHSKIAKLFGVPEDFTAKEQERLGNENQVATGVGQAAGIAGLGSALGVQESIAKAAAASVSLGASYRVGELAHQEQMSLAPFEIEHLASVFDPMSMAIDAGLGAAGPLVAKGVGAFLGTPEKAAQASAEKLFKNAKAIGRSGKSVEELAKVTRGESLLDGAAPATIVSSRLAAIGSKLEKLSGELPDDPAIKNAASTALSNIADGHLNAPGLEAEARMFRDAAARFASDPSVKVKDIAG